MDIAVFRSRPEDEIRAVLDGWRDAVKARDIDGIGAHYAPDVMAFDAVSQLRFEGLSAYEHHWRRCFATGGGEMIFDIRDLRIAAGDDLAFASFLNRTGRRDADGEESVAWLRVTICYRKCGRRWLIAHEHVSAPFDLDSCEALIDLAP